MHSTSQSNPSQHHDNSNSKFLIIGQGAIGLPVTNQLAHQGYQVTGLARGARQDYEHHAKADYLQADAKTVSADSIYSFSHIAIIVTPDTYNANTYKDTYYGIAKHLASLQDKLPNLERIVFISSTGVYGQDNGEWIDDTVTPLAPKHEASAYILQAEQVLQHAFAKRTVIIRPSGIYGKDRLMRIRKAQEANKQPIPAYAWTNRIMDSDLVTIIANVLTIKDSTSLKPIYLATDYMPVTSYELTTWLSKRLQATLPQSDDQQTKMSGKRLHSNIPRAWLDYPDWQAGYEAILHSTNKHDKR